MLGSNLEPRQVPRQRLVEVDLPFLAELEHDNGRERLSDRAVLEVRPTRHRLSRFEARESEGLRRDESVPIGDRHRKAGETLDGEQLLDVDAKGVDGHDQAILGALGQVAGGNRRVLGRRCAIVWKP